MNREFAKQYDPRPIENKWYDKWQEYRVYSNNLDNAINPLDSVGENKTYSILMPPPNVTGILHFGHVLNITLQDIYIRWKRMDGYDVCWFPGTDHAGIATQTRVEKQLKEEGLTRYDLGRDKFIEKVWAYREKYGGIIINQLKVLGISCDWEKTLFTMDESACNAVREVFIRLYDEGLIYKGKRIINWSPLSQTALSDEEVEFREVNEHFYTLKYYFADSDEYLKVATVRPETIFGDIAVAVNPNDKRFKDKIGKYVIVPVVNRKVKVIADDFADPEFGTGCVKITPAHDPNDFLVGQRHKLEMIATINPDGTMNELAAEFCGLDRFEARRKIVNKLKENDLIEKIEDYTHNVGFSQRGGEPVEPFLSNQWFVSMAPLAKEALEVVKNGDVRFFPDHWVKTYEHWLNNVKDWCISRQLWWGHRIPVYYADDGSHTAARDIKHAREKLGLPDNTPLKQDDDVLDTWFSSWLWPLTTMRWLFDANTEDTDDLNKFLPTDLLVTAPDILFFWVARMIMATMKFKKQIPFKDVYFTSMIRDGAGRKLSKSLGNSPDPLNIIEKYGADAVRFTTIYLSPLGHDVRMDVDVSAQDISSMEIGRNFANKVWNAGRFLIMKRDMAALPDICPANENTSLNYNELSLADKWILSRFNTTLKNVRKALDDYKVNDYSKTLYDFIWRDFCDWYVEILKVQLKNNDNLYNYRLTRFAANIYQDILKLLHPVMPFITEEIYHIIEDRNDIDSISLAKIPDININYINNELENQFDYLVLIIEQIRSLRATINLAPNQKAPVAISTNSNDKNDFLNAQISIIKDIANCSELTINLNGNKPANCLSAVIRETDIYLILSGDIDLSKERIRFEKEIERLERNINGSEKKLSNDKFVQNAPENVIAYEREKLESMIETLKKVKENLLALNQ